MKNLLLLAATFLSSLHAAAQADYHVIPLPDKIELRENTAPFPLIRGQLCSYPAENRAMQRNADFAKEYLRLTPQQFNKKTTTDFVLSLGLKSDNPDAYEIRVEAKQVTIQGASPSGVYYGIQTLRKSIACQRGDTILLPQGVIAATPRFSYRGCMLDCARHFFTVAEVKEYIDILALHGINTFHWHLTDDQGWRFEVKSLPQLAKRGSYRPHTTVGNNLQAGGENALYDNKPVAGYYTQDELREVVRYAAERYITIIPEIDLPGHMVAALSVYPELGCTGGPYDVWCIWGISDDVLCAGNPKVLDFLKTVYGELCDVFPSKYIHIGGDESPRVRWTKCPTCQEKMRELGLKNEAELQTYINKEMDAFLSSRGRTLIGWDETLEGGLSNNGVVMSWRGFEGGVKAARMGHDVIMTPTKHCYIDYHQINNAREVPAVIYAYLPLTRVYELEPVPSELTKEEAKHILGCQCNLWTERVDCRDVLHFQLLPRLAAMSETQWMQPTAKNFNNFVSRLPMLELLYAQLGYKYCQKYE